MKTGITTLSLIPVRSSASEQSEQVTQLLFGETFELIHTRGNWLNIRSLHDKYEGWIDKTMAKTLFSEHIPDRESVVVKDTLLPVLRSDNTNMLICGGSRIPKPDADGYFSLAGQQYQITPDIFPISKSSSFGIVETASKFLNSPYLWGGRSVLGIDCSGLTQIVCRIHGIDLPRDASQQVEIGETICFRHDAKTGDLAFFNNDKGKIVHTGIIIDENHIIHASGYVRIDKIDHSGIYNQDSGRYTHNLSVIKRLFK
jgi:gamma-D-glutamyl-L-lysine dipeptidyl-peptidase